MGGEYEGESSFGECGEGEEGKGEGTGEEDEFWGDGEGGWDEEVV